MGPLFCEFRIARRRLNYRIRSFLMYNSPNQSHQESYSELNGHTATMENI